MFHMQEVVAAFLKRGLAAGVVVPLDRMVVVVPVVMVILTQPQPVVEVEAVAVVVLVVVLLLLTTAVMVVTVMHGAAAAQDHIGMALTMVVRVCMVEVVAEQVEMITTLAVPV